MRHPLLQRWLEEGRVVSVCPETSGGLSTPRPPAEIVRLPDVVQDIDGNDVSAAFYAGAQAALALAQKHGCIAALLKDGSPSCGSGFIYDGSFSGIKAKGQGITTALLRSHGIPVFAESEIDALDLL